MGRKKKTNQTAVDVSYKGVVTVSVNRGNRKLRSGRGHNEGTNTLFNFIANCMKRQYIESDSPWYIRLFDGSDKEVTMGGSLPVQSTMTGNLTQPPVGAYVELTFTVPGTSIALDSGQSISTAKLYSLENRNNPSNPSAIATLKDAISEVEAGTNVVVVWRMEFKNVA